MNDKPVIDSLTEGFLRETMELLTRLFSTVLFFRHGEALKTNDDSDDRERALTPRGRDQCLVARTVWWSGLFARSNTMTVIPQIRQLEESWGILNSHKPNSSNRIVIPFPELYCGHLVYGDYLDWVKTIGKQLGHVALKAYVDGMDSAKCQEYFLFYCLTCLRCLRVILEENQRQIRTQLCPQLPSAATLVIPGHGVHLQALAMLMTAYWPGLDPNVRGRIMEQLRTLELGEACGFSITADGLARHNILHLPSK